MKASESVSVVGMAGSGSVTATLIATVAASHITIATMAGETPQTYRREAAERAIVSCSTS